MKAQAIVRGVVGIAAHAVAATVGWAHGESVVRPAAWWAGWTWDPAVVASLFAMGAFYVSGWRALRRTRERVGNLRRDASFFAAGWALLVVALVSPMHPWGQVYFSVHMVQHEVLMVAAAPLLVLGRPLAVMLFALPRGAARNGVAVMRRNGGRVLWRIVENPFVAWLLHALALWIWHVPWLFAATLRSEVVHALQHVSFLGTALVFWHAVIFGPRRRFGYGLGVIYLFTTAVHSGALGALLTFAGRIWYPEYGDNGGVAGLSALEDQQLGGLIMWIPAGLIYAAAALALFAAWMNVRREPRGAVAVGKEGVSCASLS